MMLRHLLLGWHDLAKHLTIFLLFVRVQADAMKQAAEAVEKHTQEKDISRAVKVILSSRFVWHSCSLVGFPVVFRHSWTRNMGLHGTASWEATSKPSSHTKTNDCWICTDLQSGAGLTPV